MGIRLKTTSSMSVCVYVWLVNLIQGDDVYILGEARGIDKTHTTTTVNTGML